MNRQLDDAIPFDWHHHKEYELTLTLNSVGQRYIGDHIGQYTHGDLVLLGPNLPHTWHSATKVDESKPHHAIVMWFTHEWAEKLFAAMPELLIIDDLLKRASRGVFFSPQFAKTIGAVIIDLVGQSEAEKTINLMAVLQRLATDEKSQNLASPIYAQQQLSHAEHTRVDHLRIDRVLEYIHQNYQQEIKIDKLADIAALSHSGFYRMFLRYTHHKPSDYIIRLRIGKACALLIESPKPIATISDEVGFYSLANFNRQFKRIKSVTPREFRGGYIV